MGWEAGGHGRELVKLAGRRCHGFAELEAQAFNFVLRIQDHFFFPRGTTYGNSSIPSLIVLLKQAPHPKVLLAGHTRSHRLPRIQND